MPLVAPLLTKTMVGRAAVRLAYRLRVPACKPPMAIARAVGLLNTFSLTTTASGQARGEGLFAQRLASGFASPALNVLRDNQTAEIAPSDKLNSLVEQLRDQALRGARSGGASGSQAKIDKVLEEIGQLVGKPLRLGGVERAVVSGIDKAQFSDFEVRTLRPNASATFTGNVGGNSKAASVTIDNFGSALGSGGFLQIESAAGRGQLRVQAGESASAVAARINRSGAFGNIVAREANGTLQISTKSTGRFAHLRVVSSGASSEGGTSYGGPEITGVNAAQVESLDASGLTVGTDVNVTGSVDSLATAPQLTYVGGSGGIATGTATFELTGPSGTASIALTDGESLGDVVDRINGLTDSTGVVASIDGDNLVLQTSDTGATQTISVGNAQRAEEVEVTGVNGTQVANFAVASTPSETTVQIDGTITQAADRAELTYLGGSGGLVVDSATFTLTGNLGSTSIAITQGESLSDVADRINAAQASTGVTAITSGDNLLINSSEVGSAQTAAISLDSITQYISTSGVNASQITSFSVLSTEPDTVKTLNGTVDQTADVAELTYTGISALGSRTSSAATFTLTGDLGSAEISVANLELLSDVRDRINAETGNTGVVASLSGTTITLNSQEVGSASTIEVAVTSGTFNTAGGNGDGTANGLDALLTLNGQSVTAAGLDVSYTIGLDSYDFSLATGFTGALDEITVTSDNGTFDIAGGNGDGTANGQDALGTIDGQAVAAVGSQFSLSIDGGVYELEAAAGFVGTLDTITVASTLADFSVTGGDGNGNATGTDGNATINGQSLASTNNSYSFDTGSGTLDIDFAAGFTGAFDPIAITFPLVEDQPVSTAGQEWVGYGSESLAQLNAEQVQRRGDTLIVQQGGVEIALQIAEGFSGAFTPFTVSAAASELTTVSSPFTQEQAATLQKALDPLTSLASGGEFADLSLHSSKAIELSVLALRELATLLGQSSGDGFARRQLTSSGSLFDRFV